MRKRHIVICGLSGPYHSFPHYLMNGTIFLKPSLNTKCVFRFCVQIWPETILILRTIPPDLIKVPNRSSCSYSSHSLMDLQFSRQISEKYSNIKLLENPSGSRIVPCGRKDRRIDGHDKVNSLFFFQFCEPARLVSNHTMVSEVLPQETELPE